MMWTVARAAASCLIASARLVFAPGVSTPSVISTMCRLPSGLSLNKRAAATRASENRARFPGDNLVFSTLKTSSLSWVHDCISSTLLLNCITANDVPVGTWFITSTATCRVSEVCLDDPPVSYTHLRAHETPEHL